MKRIERRRAAGAIFLCLGIWAFLCFGIKGEAAKTASHDLKITGGEHGQDYRYDNDILLILSDTPLTISGTTKKEGIRVKEGTDAHLTLKNTDIRVAGGCVLDAGSDRLFLKLSGENYLKSGAKYPGILVREGSEVIISGGKSDSLMVFGGSQAAGIGSEKENVSGSVTIEGGTITAVGGARAAGIGGGFQGGGGRITITGGRTLANGGAGAADIGSPQEGYGKGSITLNGNCILQADDIKDTLTAKNGILLSGSRGNVYQEVALSYPLEISRNTILTIPSGSRLEIPEKIQCVNKGEIYVYGQLIVKGKLDNQGQIYDYAQGLEQEGDLTGNEVTLRDLHEIDLRNGSVRFTRNGYEQDGIEFNSGESGSGVYSICGNETKDAAQIIVEDGVQAALALEDVTLRAGENGHCLSVGKDAEVILIIRGDNTFLAGKSALSECIYSDKNSSVVIRGDGLLTLQDESGRRLVISGGNDEGETVAAFGEEIGEDSYAGQGNGEDSYAGQEDGGIALSEDALALHANIWRGTLESLEEERQSLEIRGKMIRIQLDWRAVRELLDDTAGDIEFLVRPFVLGEKFSNAMLFIAGRPVYDIQVIDKAGGEEKVENVHFTEGTATISIPYRMPAEEDRRKLYVVYVGADNTIEWLENSYYDASTKEMVSQVKHFSVYGIGYQVGVG